MLFKDERINFCLETYLKTSICDKVLKIILNEMSNEFYTAINNYNSHSAVIRNKKYMVDFCKLSHSNSVDYLLIQMQDGKDLYSFKIFYTYINAEAAQNSELSRSFINFEKHKIKGIFSSKQKLVGIYSNIAFTENNVEISCIEDNGGKISKYGAALSKKMLPVQMLKPYKFYKYLDEKIANEPATK